MKNTILFGIVTYGEIFWECDSYLSLVSSYKKSKHKVELSIFIFDNTDKDNWGLNLPPVDDDIRLNYFHDSSNPGISFAYNSIAEFAKENDFKTIVFLDQDTSLPEDFFEIYYSNCALLDDQNPIAVPLIYSNNNLMSPSNFFSYRSSILKTIPENKLVFKDISFINSGMLLSTDFFFKAGGYNKKLRLDFCDHDFVQRASNFTQSVIILPIMLVQNFSSETNNLQKSLVRYRLFVQDMKEYSKDKNKFLFFLRIDLPHLLKETYRNRSFEFLKIRFF